MSEARKADSELPHYGRGNPREDRDEIVAEICERLATGEALATMLRESPGYPSVSTLWVWERADPAIAEAISRARRLGHHAIATDLRKTARGEAGYSTGDVQRDKLIVDTDIRLLAKWDPRYYGDSQQLRLADANGAKLDTAPLIGELLGMLGGSAPADAPIDVTPRRIERATGDSQPAIRNEESAASESPVRAFDNPSYKPRARRVITTPAADVDDLV